jgi:hypothetical protein
VANEIRIRQNFIGGLVEDNPLTSGATTLTSAALAALVAIGSTEHAVIVLDPDGMSGEPEEVWVTAHTAGATTATIARAKGYPASTARAHDRDTPWVHTAVNTDFYGTPGGMGLIGQKTYNPTITDVGTTNATLTDIDATNLIVTFVAPPSGTVLIRLYAICFNSGSNYTYWGLRDGGSDVSGSKQRMVSATSEYFGRYIQKVTGLTPGTSYTYKWAQAAAAGTGTTRYGGDAGNAVMEVWAVNGA